MNPMNEYLQIVQSELSGSAGLGAWNRRHTLCERFAWAVPDDEALNVLVSLAPLVEIGAGGGYWAHLLRTERVVDILAYDAKPGHNRWVKRQWTKVRRGGPKKASKFPGRTLFLCWPPYATSMAAECLKHYRGNVVAYVGEGPGGCTGDDEFFDLLHRDFELAHRQNLTKWEGIHDSLDVFRRKE